MHPNSKNRKRKQAKQRLILATEQIIEQEGMDAVTVKKVAQEAEMNSALIYTHFEDIQHLIYYALIGYLKEYNTALATKVDPEATAKEQILQVFEVFCQYAFQLEPAIYYTLFFSKYSRNLAEIQWEYYDLFDLALPVYNNQTIDQMIRSETVFSRNHVLLEQLVHTGELSAAQEPIVNEIIVYAQQSLLYNKLAGVSRNTKEELTRKLMSIIRYVLGMT
jgi:AcrR family transcriptional regulator